MTHAERPGETPVQPRAGQRRGPRTGRLEALSDGVLAIAVTLLVLDIKIPAGAPSASALLRELGHLWPSYLAYVVSSSRIGAIRRGRGGRRYLAVAVYLIVPIRRGVIGRLRRRRRARAEGRSAR